ncbi:tyrosine-type recombinase/integrase [Terrisporobacter mayombei]|nr:tyrosine-type recombinase/integrase [Terrisporobacter mayombei]
MGKQVYNNYNTAEKWHLVNDYNKNLLEDWELQLKSEGKSKKTIKVYLHNVKVLFVYILEELGNKPICELKKKQFRNYVLWLKSLGLSSARIKNLNSASSSMLNFACDDEDYEEDIPVNYFGKLKPIASEKRREIIFLTNKQVEIIYNELMERENYRDALLIAISFESLARRNEIFQLKKDWISMDSNMTKEKVRGKRGKTFNLFYFDKTKEAYSKYMEQRNDDNEDLWVDKDGNSITYDSLYGRVVECRKILEKKTGVYLPFSNHSFRHSGAQCYKESTHWALNGTDKRFTLVELQALMNHSDISTTQSYLMPEDTQIILNAFGISEDKNK